MNPVQEAVENLKAAGRDVDGGIAIDTDGRMWHRVDGRQMSTRELVELAKTVKRRS
jgi:hypothetical protein